MKLPDNLKRAINNTIEIGYGSTSYLQRSMRIGYNEAVELMDKMYGLGVIDKSESAKPRKLLIKSIDDILI
jgi:DNA segregation ATPase FtsK/SpoIIIE-like protein